MGGGGDSRIPSILKENLGPEYEVIIRTYDFDPEIANGQISSWVNETSPDLIIGESLGAIHAIAIKGRPHILVSPSLNAPRFLSFLSKIVWIPGVTALLDSKFHPKPGDRQPLHFVRKPLSKWPEYEALALSNAPSSGSKDYFHAFFGRKDHYRRMRVVSVRRWKRLFGPDTCTEYPGTHFMEEEFIHSLLIPEIKKVMPAD